MKAHVQRSQVYSWQIQPKTVQSNTHSLCNQLRQMKHYSSEVRLRLFRLFLCEAKAANP